MRPELRELHNASCNLVGSDFGQVGSLALFFVLFNLSLISLWSTISEVLYYVYIPAGVYCIFYDRTRASGATPAK